MAAPEKLQTIRMTDELYDRVAQYADDNAMPVSEALREVLGAYARGEVTPPDRRRRSRRVSLWIDPTLWTQFKVRSAHDGVSITDAIEEAIKENT